MGILDSVIGNLLGGGANSTSSPMGNILSGLLTGGQGGMGGGLGGGPGGMGGFGAGSSGMGGGLGGLLSQFERAGLGHVAGSWVGSGQNQPVSPDQLRTVFGEDRVRGMADQAGVPTHDFLNQLSQHLPQAVDGMTPNGRLPDEGTISV